MNAIVFQPVETLRGFWQAAEILERDAAGRPIEFLVSGRGHRNRDDAESECERLRRAAPPA